MSWASSPWADLPWASEEEAAAGVTGTSATTNANDTSAASGTTTVVGTSATTNAADTSSASGSVGGAVSGSAATTNANDTAAAAGTTTVTGTAATTNAADSSAAAGWAGTVTGEVAATNANDYATASGEVEQPQSSGGRITRRGRTKFPRQEQPQEPQAAAPVDVSATRASLLPDAGQLVVAKGNEAVRLARTSQAKRRKAIEMDDERAIEAALLDFF